MDLRVFHTGDLHLDMLYQSRGYPEEVREELVEARYRVLEKMVEEANRQDCHLFVLAGDLFDRATVKENSVLKALDTLSRFEGVCAVLPGNHDYYTPHSSLWESVRKHAAPNVLALFQNSPYDLRDYGLDVALYPAPCHARRSLQNRMGWIWELHHRPEVRWHLGVAHGSLEEYSPDFQENYFPMREEELISAGMHFWFLGHTHARIPEGEHFDGHTFAYCGTPEPDGFGCRHTGTAWVVELNENGKIEGTTVSTGQYCFWNLERRVTSPEDMEEIVRELTEDGGKTLARLNLHGSLPREDFENRQRWIEELQEKLFYLELDDTGLQVEITRETIAELFPESSFPYMLLNRLVERGDQKALQVAYSLIKEVNKYDHSESAARAFRRF